MIKSIVFALMTLSSCSAIAQNELVFDKFNVQCEDKWVAKPISQDSTYSFGFIYIDESAGLTFHYEGKFKIKASKWLRVQENLAPIKVRLQPNQTKLAEIPSSKFAELAIKAIPDWLSSYKKNAETAEYLYQHGYLYNGWGDCSKALTYLEKAVKINPRLNGLEVELAFSYNCLGKYEQAVTALEQTIQQQPTDAYVNKELIYAYIKSNQLNKASECLKKTLVVCTDQTYHAENCYNLLYNYYLKKDKEGFNAWLSETQRWTASHANLVQSIKNMEKELNQIK